MNLDSRSSGRPIPVTSPSLGRVLSQTEEIKEKVEEAASDLSSVNEILKQGKEVALPAQAIEPSFRTNRSRTR